MTAPIADIVSEAQLRASFRKHATLAQLNRLWQYQERPASGLANLLDMMDPDVVVRSSHLDVRGHAALQDAMAQIPLDWRAAHVLRDWRISVDGATNRLDARLEYLTEAADGTATAEAHYDASFRNGDALLPLLTRIDVTQGEARPGGEFADMFAEHRVRGAVHYFMALVENPARQAEPFMELLADNFSLHYTAEPLTSREAVRDWVAGPLSSVIASEHDLHSVTCRDLGDGRYVADVAMKSQAMFPDKSGAISRNTQRWTLTDSLGDRFPKINEILIERDSVVRFDCDGRQTG